MQCRTRQRGIQQRAAHRRPCHPPKEKSIANPNHTASSAKRFPGDTHPRAKIIPVFRKYARRPYLAKCRIQSRIRPLWQRQQLILIPQPDIHLQPLASSCILGSIGNIVTWELMVYNMLIFYSALRVVPGKLYEAAEIDGAGAFRTVVSSMIPALRGAIVIATIFFVIGSFQLVNEPNLLKALAPNAITS